MTPLPSNQLATQTSIIRSTARRYAPLTTWIRALPLTAVALFTLPGVSEPTAPDTNPESLPDRWIMGFDLAASLVIAILFAGCGGSSNDGQTPSAISDLAGRAVNDSTIVLNWSAPGVGRRSTVSGYDIRYSETAAGLDSAERYVRWPFFGRPASPGSMDSVTVAGLKRGNPYFFRVWGLASDGEPGEDGNIAEVSTLPDTVPPGRITDLAVTSRGADRLTLTWTAPGDDADRGQATSYRIAVEPGAHETVNLAQATIQTPSERPYLAGVQQQATVLNLSPRASYTIVVLARDEVGQESPPSNVAVGTTDRLPQDWYVYADRSGDAPTIQAAIDSTRDGEIVWIGPGTYHENLRILDQPEDLRSLDGPEATIIDGSTRPASVIEIRRTLRDTTHITGLAITGGWGTPPKVNETSDPSGGGIFGQDSHVEVNNCIIRQNGMPRSTVPQAVWGGGLYCEQRYLSEEPALTIAQCDISDNTSAGNGGGIAVGNRVCPRVLASRIIRNRALRGDGGGIWLLNFNGPAQVKSCVIEHNNAGDHGAGIYASPANTNVVLEITNSLIASNTALQDQGGHIHTEEVGAGIWLRSLTGCIDQCTIVANQGPTSEPARGGGISLSYTRDVVIVRTIVAFTVNNGGLAFFGTTGTRLGNDLFWNNGGGDIVGTDTLYASAGSLEDDPRFCDPILEEWSLAGTSPALHSEAGRIGADTGVGCAGTTSRRSTRTWSGPDMKGGQE